MELQKPSHKVFLYQLIQQRNFPIGQLQDAASVAKKLLQGSVTEDRLTAFSDEMIVISPDELVLLKNVFKEIKEAAIKDADTVAELKVLFEL